MINDADNNTCSYNYSQIVSNSVCCYKFDLQKCIKLMLAMVMYISYYQRLVNNVLYGIFRDAIGFIVDFHS